MGKVLVYGVATEHEEMKKKPEEKEEEKNCWKVKKRKDDNGSLADLCNFTIILSRNVFNDTLNVLFFCCFRSLGLHLFPSILEYPCIMQNKK